MTVIASPRANFLTKTSTPRLAASWLAAPPKPIVIDLKNTKKPEHFLP